MKNVWILVSGMVKFYGYFWFCGLYGNDEIVEGKW